MSHFLYCDGASGNRRGKPGGYGWVALSVEPAASRVVAHGWGGEEFTSNNRMELRAIEEGLRFYDCFFEAAYPPLDLADRRLPSPLTVVSDSQVALGVISGLFHPTANAALVALVREKFIALRATTSWIRGHQALRAATLASLTDEVLLNECCDVLAGLGKVERRDFSCVLAGHPAGRSKFFTELSRRFPAAS